MKKTYTILLAFLLVVTFSFTTVDVQAMPAYTEYLTESQPDGSVFKFKIMGDENFSYCIDKNNKIIQKDKKDNTWRLVLEKNGKLSLGSKAGEKDKNDLLELSKITDAQIRKQYKALVGENYNGENIKINSEVTSLSDLNKGGTLSNGAGNIPSHIPLLSIVVEFNDMKYSEDYNWSDIIFENQYGLTKYYESESLGQVAIVKAQETSEYNIDGNKSKADSVNDGIIHISLNRNHGNWKGGFNDNAVVSDMLNMFIDAAGAADNYIDFSQYDVNGNGKLEMSELAIQFIVAGYETSCNQEINPSIWAHQWNLDALKEYESGFQDADIIFDNVMLSPYITMGENLNLSGTSDVEHNTISATIHEFGHLLGLPDLYDTANSSDGEWDEFNVGYSSIMAAGSWGMTINGEFRPTCLDPYSRITLGFIEPEKIGKSGIYEVTSRDSEQGYKAYILPTSKATEYYILENRQFSGFDEGLYEYNRFIPNLLKYDNCGIILWHIDENVINERDLTATDIKKVNTVNTLDHRPGVMPCFNENLNNFYDMPFFNNKMMKEENYQWNTKLYNGDLKNNRIESQMYVTLDKDNGTDITAKVVFGKSDFVIKPMEKIYGDKPFKLETVGGRGTGAIKYSASKDNKVIKLEGDVVKILAPGTVTINAVKAADENFDEQKATYKLTIKPNGNKSVTKVKDNSMKTKAVSKAIGTGDYKYIGLFALLFLASLSIIICLRKKYSK